MALKLPTLVIVGRPNVGKSTLFNRFAGRRIAVVQDMPGVTRDRLYAEAVHRGRRYRVVDTGGILFGDDDPLVEQIRVQAEVAMAEADVILFVVDTKEGPMPADWDLARRLRMSDIPVHLVANKADNLDQELQAQEFASMGLGPVHPVSAIHGYGTESILDLVLADAPKIGAAEDEAELRLAILGRPNVGKSSMLNAFAGSTRAIVSEIAGTTRDALDTEVTWKGREIRLIDTAGIRRRGKIQGSIEYYMVLRAQRALQRAECALVVIDGDEGLTDGDKRVAHLSLEMGKPLVIAVNKWDLKEGPDGRLGETTDLKKSMRRKIYDEIPEMRYAPVVFTSAQSATGMDGVMNAVFRAVESWETRITTGVLNRLIQEAVDDKPLNRKGKPFRVYYATQPEARPPKILIFGNDPDLCHFSYLRYLENRLRDKFPLEGTPVVMEVRSSREAD
ncbi:MAG: ribosome biogenesis GTPase Der [Fimbriimonadaceae bacterium]|nr:ribosome biogenesis GTPase Der [Fimbriimonadaceae bacterium]